MALSVEHNSIDEIPEQYRELYTERDGKFQLTGIAGIKTQSDIDRLNGALEKERNDHKEARDKLSSWTTLGDDPSEISGRLDRITELEVAAEGNKDGMDEKLEKLTEARVASRLAPFERENKTLKEKIQGILEENESLKNQKIRRTIHDEVRAAGNKSKINSDAEPDVLLLSDAVFSVTETGEVLTKENDYGVAPGLSPDLFFQEMRDKRTHWWPPNVGGGSPGSGRSGGGGFSKNPFSKDHWNLTEQGRVVKEHGEEKARAMAKAVGVELGQSRPAL